MELPWGYSSFSSVFLLFSCLKRKVQDGVFVYQDNLENNLFFFLSENSEGCSAFSILLLILHGS